LEKNMKSVMKHSFSDAPTIDAPRSRFDRSHGLKTAFDAGYLIPIYVDDVLPGDTFNMNMTGFARLATPEFPIMDNMYLDTHFFFVPLRLVWDNSKKFFGEQVDPGDSIDYQIPTFSSFTPAQDSLSDYLGLPPGNAMTPVSIYHRGYNLCWNEWFRDQNLQDSLVVDTDDGPDTATDYVLKRRGKRHDYFTSCLPWPQKGDAVDLPLGTSAPILGDGTAMTFNDGSSISNLRYVSGDTQWSSALAAATNIRPGTLPLSSGGTGMYADLTGATAATINDLREAFQVQKLLERDARGGTRYAELVRNHFGVNFYDVSYRPEFLGGGSTPININPVARTADNAALSTYAGDLAAFGTAGFGNHGFTKSFVEHGFVLGLASVRADLTYQQGIPRNFSKSTRYDVYWPSLAHLGEQEILTQELVYQNNATYDDVVFGYQERYAEYRYKPSQITSTFRSSHSLSLDPWHLSQELGTGGSTPVLGDTFIQENPPVDRAIVTITEPHFIMDCYFDLKCARPMPVFGVPGMIDHF
jgi:hypothetical protein